MQIKIFHSSLNKTINTILDPLHHEQKNLTGRFVRNYSYLQYIYLIQQLCQLGLQNTSIALLQMPEDGILVAERSLTRVLSDHLACNTLKSALTWAWRTVGKARSDQSAGHFKPKHQYNQDLTVVCKLILLQTNTQPFLS